MRKALLWLLFGASLSLIGIRAYQMNTRATRNNNPGNLRFANQRGSAGKDDLGFAIFSTSEGGWNALIRQIGLDQNRGLTLRQFITKYAPAHENDTSNYLNYVSKRLGVTPDALLADIEAKPLAVAISKMEGYHGDMIA